MDVGFYWVRLNLRNASTDLTVGHYCGATDEDGNKENYPWTIVGCDDIFGEQNIIVVAPIDEPVNSSYNDLSIAEEN